MARRKSMQRKKFVNKKKKYNRRLKKGAQSITVRGPNAAIVPDRLFTKLKFYRTASAVPSVASPSMDFRLSGNSVYNCDADTTTQVFSALGLLKLGGLYNRFRVHASKIVCRAVSTDTNAGSYVKWVVCPSTSTLLTGANILSRFPYAKTNTLSANAGVNRSVIKNMISTKKLYGLKDISQQDIYSGTCKTAALASPATQWYWHIAIDSINGSANLSGGIYIDFEITYYVELYDRFHIQAQDVDDDETPLTQV